jgi:hypothetical protein
MTACICYKMLLQGLRVTTHDCMCMLQDVVPARVEGYSTLLCMLQGFMPGCSRGPI